MPKRKASGKEKDEHRNSKRRRLATTQVVVKQPRYRSVVPAGPLDVRKDAFRSFNCWYHVQSLAGDVGGSTMFFRPYRINQPFDSAYTVPTHNLQTPNGWSSYQSHFQHYIVTAVSLKVLWQPTFQHQTLSRPHGNQTLSFQWGNESSLKLSTAYNGLDIHANPKRVKSIVSQGMSLYSGGDTENDTDKYFIAKKYTKKFYRKPIMDLSNDRIEEMNQDRFTGWIQLSDLTFAGVNPGNVSDRWGCRIDVLPFDLDITTSIYYDLMIKVKYYVRFFDPQPGLT